jgi:hypothetical protein
MTTETTQNGRKNNSPIDFANKGIGMVQNARNAQKIASTIQKAKKIQAAVSIAASTWEIWVPILIISIIVLLFFAVIFGGDNSSQSTTSQQPLPTAEAGPPPPIQGQLLTCPSGDYKTCLSDDFNIVVNNAQGNDLSRIFQSFAFVGQSKQYVDLLTRGGQITINMVYNLDGCHGYTKGYAGVITIYGAGLCATYGLPTFRYLIIHESGHVLNARNRPLFYSYPWTNYKSQPPDSSCYLNGFLKSYAQGAGVDPKDESFSESIADSLRQRSYSGISPAQPINNFATECPMTYLWFETNVFGGYTYF